MGKCQLCRKEEYMLFKCSYCGQYFCSEHRLPEKHLCPDLPKKDWSTRRNINEKPMPATKVGNYPTDAERRAFFANNKKIEYKSDSKGKILLVLILSISAFLIVYSQNNEFQTVINDYISNNTLPNQNNDKKYDLAYFESLDELVTFLNKDNTSEITYTEDFTCGDFSDTLIERAKNSGYQMNYYVLTGADLDEFVSFVESIEYIVETNSGTTTYTFSYGEGEGHAICSTRINDEEVFIEPQSDQVFSYVNNMYSVLYFGDIIDDN